MAATGGGGGGGSGGGAGDAGSEQPSFVRDRAPRPPPPRPTITLPPRSSAESLFGAPAHGGNGGGSSSERSPGPLSLASSLFTEDPESVFRSYTHLLIGTEPSPSQAMPPQPPPPRGGSSVINHPLAAHVTFTPPGQSSSPTMFSNWLVQGPRGFEVSHQQALAEVQAQAAQSIYVHNRDYSSFALVAPGPGVLSSHVDSSVSVAPVQNMPSLDPNSGRCISEYAEGAEAINVDKPPDDGYNWRKYGQKTVKGGEYPRSYYKCTYPNCIVRKKIERSRDGYITQIIYTGKHNHQQPPRRRSRDGSSLANESDDFDGSQDVSAMSEHGSQVYSGNDTIAGPSSSHRYTDQYDSSDDDMCEDESKDDADNNSPNANRRNLRALPAQKIILQTTSDIDLLDDGYKWRKYGQKVVKGNPYPRSYYKCTHQGCSVKKHIERCSADPRAVITTYEGKHIHDVPAGRGSSQNAAAFSTINLQNQPAFSSTSMLSPVQSTSSNQHPQGTDLNDEDRPSEVLQPKEEKP